MQDAKSICSSATIPEQLIGCWERRCIRFPDGTDDKTTRAIWLQTLSGVGDIRIAGSRPNLSARKGLGNCSKQELLKLAEQDCFCGITLFDPDTNPRPTASWPIEAQLFRFQPAVTFPEPGWIEWQHSCTCLIERAPSGAYEEDWRLQPGSQSFAAHLTKNDSPTTTCLYVAGEHAIYARNRTENLSAGATLLELAREAHYEHGRLQQLVDCEFSYARRAKSGGDYWIELSTLPWREGHPLGCSWLQNLASVASLESMVLDEKWTVESLWYP